MPESYLKFKRNFLLRLILLTPVEGNAVTAVGTYGTAAAWLDFNEQAKDSCVPFRDFHGCLRKSETAESAAVRQIKTKQLLDYWLTLFREINGTEKNIIAPLWPDRRSIQPAHCRSLLSEMFILESLGGPYYYRLAGTNLCSLYGRELKREKFSKAFIGNMPDNNESWLSGLSLDEQVVLIGSVAELDTNEKINLETLILPLSNSSGTGKRVLGITVSDQNGSGGLTGGIVAHSIRSARVLRPWEHPTSLTVDDKKLGRGHDSLPVNRRIDLVAPPLFPKNEKLLNTIETNDPRPQYKRIGHLVVIEGGRSS